MTESGTAILDALARSSEPLPLSRLRGASGLSLSTLSRHLREFARLRYVEPVGSDWTITEVGRRVLGLPREIAP